MVRPLFEIFVFITLTSENYITFGYSAGSLIWCQKHNDFIPIENTRTFKAVQQDYLRKSRELEIHDFQNEVLKAAYHEVKNMINFYDNDTKITGVTGELWNMLSEHLNFKMVIVRTQESSFGAKLPDGSYDGVLGMLTRNDIQIILRTKYFSSDIREMAYTIPVWDTSYRVYIRPESKSDSNWMFHMFSRTVWCSILLLFVILSVLGYTMQRMSIRVSGDKNCHHNLHDHFFYTFATFCCQGFVPNNLYHRTKILSLSKSIFAWLLLISVSSSLISYTTNKKVQQPFEDLLTMLSSTTYNMVVFNELAIYTKFQKLVAEVDAIDRYKNRITHVKSVDRMYEKCCWGKRKYAIFEAEDVYRAAGRLKCYLVATGKSYYPTWIAASVSKTFKYRRTLDMGILKLNEFGLTSGLLDRWMVRKMIKVELNVVNPVNFDQVSMLFVILCIGMITSIVIFILENIVYLYHYNRRQIRRRTFFYLRG